MVSDRAFIFHIHIAWDKALSLVTLKSRSSVKVKVKYQGHSFSKKWPLPGHSCFTNTSCFVFWYRIYLFIANALDFDIFFARKAKLLELL